MLCEQISVYKTVEIYQRSQNILSIKINKQINPNNVFLFILCAYVFVYLKSNLFGDVESHMAEGGEGE